RRQGPAQAGPRARGLAQEPLRAVPRARDLRPVRHPARGQRPGGRRLGPTGAGGHSPGPRSLAAVGRDRRPDVAGRRPALRRAPARSRRRVDRPGCRRAAGRARLRRRRDRRRSDRAQGGRVAAQARRRGHAALARARAGAVRVTNIRALESPLAAWRSFRDIARATQTLAAAQSLQWAERSRRADEHLAWCEALAAEYPLTRAEPRSRVVLAIGTDLGLCGPLNRLLFERCAEQRLDAEPTVLRIVVGSRLASLEPFAEAVELATPSTMSAALELAADIEGLIDQLPDPLRLDLTIALAGAV